MKESLHSKLTQYSKNGRLAFHMPGHKRRGFESCPALSAAASIDITEIDGFDDLHRPDGVIRNTEQKGEKLYNSKKCFISTNGSTCGILASIRTAFIMGQKQNKNKIAIARNCHKSVYNGIELCGAAPCYIIPDMIDSIGCYGSVSPNSVKKLFGENNNICALVITSPTYEGIISDICEIADIVHKNGAFLIVDEAHGPHLPFMNNKNSSSITLGADIVIHSLHKTLSCLTQSASVHVGRNSTVDIDILAKQMSVFNTSSPSYPIMASIDYCFDNIPLCLESKFRHWQLNNEKGRKQLENLKKLSLFEKPSEVFKLDTSKFVISTVNSSIDGYELSSVLRKNYNIECESANQNYIIAMTGEETAAEEIQCLVEALLEIDSQVESTNSSPVKTFRNTVPNIILNPSQALKCNTELCNYKDSEGMISGEYLWLYPPGIPFLVPGESIDINTITIIDNYQKRMVSDRCSNNFDGFLTVLSSSINN